MAQSQRTLKSPVFIAAMRLRDVAREVALILQQFPASFELTEDELVVYSWSEMDLQSAVSAIHDVVGEREFEVYKFAGKSRSKQAFYTRLAYWNTHYDHCVCVQVDKHDRHRYFVAGLVSHVQLLCEDLLPYWRRKIVRNLTPEQTKLLLAYGGSLFDSVDDCHMTLSADNNEMVVYCTQRAEAAVIEKWDSILCVIMSLSCTDLPEADTDIIAMTRLLNAIEIDNRVVMQCDQSDDRDKHQSRSEQMLVGPSYCVNTSKKTQLRLVDEDITDLCVDAIVSTIDEHGTPNTELARRIVTTGLT
jgi:hypothetical protein